MSWHCCVLRSQEANVEQRFNRHCGVQRGLVSAKHVGGQQRAAGPTQSQVRLAHEYESLDSVMSMRWSQKKTEAMRIAELTGSHM